MTAATGITCITCREPVVVHPTHLECGCGASFAAEPVASRAGKFVLTLVRKALR